MKEYITFFAIIIAVIIVTTRIILAVLEEKDRAKGMIINKKEYKMSGLLGIICSEHIQSIKNFFKQKRVERSSCVKSK